MKKRIIQAGVDYNIFKRPDESLHVYVKILRIHEDWLECRFQDSKSMMIDFESVSNSFWYEKGPMVLLEITCIDEGLYDYPILRPNSIVYDVTQKKRYVIG